jgi:hypothetical protein
MGDEFFGIMAGTILLVAIISFAVLKATGTL